MTQPVQAAQVRVHDEFFSRLCEIARRDGLPYQWEALNDRLPDTEPSYCIQNFRIAAGMEQGEHHGCAFQDSDVAKWLEAVAFSLMWHPDEELERTADGAIDLVCAAQRPDGYLGTLYTIKAPDRRWTNLKDHHEMYIAGHMIEAAVAYYQATGKRKLLDACLRLVDHIDSIFGPEEGKLKGYPGHPVLEMALVRLYEVTHDEKHLRLAKYLVDQRGQQPLFFDEETRKNGNTNPWEEFYKLAYYQADKPVREQTVALGHAVRALYLYSGMEDVARETADDGLHRACQTLWEDVTRRQMYITGAVGSSEYGESFSYDYNLPNDLVYGETCASIALVFFAQRMLRAHVRGDYADVMERALYNGVISGMQLDGKRFFYVNPLEVVPEACEKDYLYRHVKPERQKWFGCACCPPNIMRLLTSLGQYIYSTDEDTVYTHLYIGGEADVCLNGRKVHLDMNSSYPWSGEIALRVQPEAAARFSVALRIPGWCGKYALKLNGQTADFELREGYAYIDRQWQPGDEITLILDMPVRVYRANPRVREDAGKLAVMRGPVVYCLEEPDNGADLHLIRLDPQTAFEVKHEPETLGGVTALYCNALREDTAAWNADDLYAPATAAAYKPCRLKWIPYYTWANRGVGEMAVWVRA